MSTALAFWYARANCRPAETAASGPLRDVPSTNAGTEPGSLLLGAMAARTAGGDQLVEPSSSILWQQRIRT